MRVQGKSMEGIGYEGDLDDHVVHPVHVELDLGARVGVRQSQLGFTQLQLCQRLSQARRPHADGPQHLHRSGSVITTRVFKTKRLITIPLTF